MDPPSPRTVANAFVLLLLVLGILLAVLLVAPGLLGAEQTFVVQSDSMSPAIGAGDLAIVGAADLDDLSPGTVITFRSAGDATSVVTHRIVDVERTDNGVRYRTKGDANEEPDQELVAPSQVVGTVWFTIPLVGYLVSFASTDFGILALVVVPAILLVVSEIYEMYRDAREAEGNAEGSGQ